MEAVRGLDAPQAQLNASAAERRQLDAGLLKDVCAAVEKSSGKAVKLTLAEASPLEAQGVLVTTVDGRMAFNNQVKTRMLRNQRKIHMMIHKALFEK